MVFLFLNCFFIIIFYVLMFVAIQALVCFFLSKYVNNFLFRTMINEHSSRDASLCVCPCCWGTEKPLLFTSKGSFLNLHVN